MEQGDIVSNERPSKAVLRAVEAVQANIDTVVESMMEAYRAHIPSYRAADPAPLDGVAQAQRILWTLCPVPRTTRRPGADRAFWHWGDGAQDGPHSSWGPRFYPLARP